MKLSIVVPAYNEEAAIGPVIENILEARSAILERSPVKAVEVIVVNDGSKDRTAEVVRRYPEAVLVEHPVNRGYGAALTTGFERATGDVLAFLDGDGTCDARDFVGLCGELERADMVLGTRLGAGSRMPLVRRIGNRLFAALTGLLSGKAVTDIATGMRVMRREAWEKLPALPDGLHYSPAMTCHALYLRNLRVSEHEISYADRVGKSKLSVVKDGLRFLKIILDSALVYFPLKILGGLGFLFVLLGAAYGAGPVLHYLRHRALEEGMIYRLISVLVFASAGFMFVLVGVAAQKMALLMGDGEAPRSWILRAIRSRRFSRRLLAAGIVLALAGVGLNAGNILDYFAHGRIGAHWSYLLLGGLFVLGGASLFALAVLSRMVDLLKRQS